MRQAGITCLLVLASSASMAGEGNGFLYGAGIDSCGRWLEDRKSNAWYPTGQWLLGFMSAASTLSAADIKKRTDSSAFAAFVDKHCTANPLDQVSDAALALLKELSK